MTTNFLSIQMIAYIHLIATKKIYLKNAWAHMRINEKKHFLKGKSPLVTPQLYIGFVQLWPPTTKPDTMDIRTFKTRSIYTLRLIWVVSRWRGGGFDYIDHDMADLLVLIPKCIS